MRSFSIFILGILSAYNDVKYKRPSSNRESGRGKYDVLVERAAANYIFEFKVADCEEDIEKAVENALAQIDEKRYGQDLDSTKPLVKIGIGLYGKQCLVKVAK